MFDSIVVPAEFEPGYSPAIDRIDVAIRAVMKLFRQRNWPLLAELGIGKECEPTLIVAELVVEDYRNDMQIAALLETAPFILGSALECLRRYNSVTRNSKRQWTRERKAQHGNLSH